MTRLGIKRRGENEYLLWQVFLYGKCSTPFIVIPFNYNRGESNLTRDSHRRLMKGRF